MTETRNLAAAAVSFLAGILLIVSGTQGPVAVYELVLQNLSTFVADSALLSVLTIVVLILIGLSSLGGLAVMIAGYMIYRNHVRMGKIMIGLGAGVGIPWLILIVFSFAVTRELSSIAAQHSLIGWIGVLLAFIARTIATGEKRAK
jgi:hypothetical protein